MNKQIPQKTRLILVISFLALVLIGSIIALFAIRQSSKGALVAYIYQDGRMLREIPLDMVTETYTIEVRDGTIYTDSNATDHPSETGIGSGRSDGYNLIEVRPGSIGIIEANCPDKLCVHMGFQDSAMVPITCLPNKVVIQLRIENNSDNKLDGISH